MSKCEKCGHEADVVPKMARPNGWIPVSERLPESGLPVLAFADNGKGWTRRLRALWCAKGTVESSCEDNDNDEYDEAKDQYFVREGWYENNEYEESHWGVADPVTHWMPLPPPPGDAPEEHRP